MCLVAIGCTTNVGREEEELRVSQQALAPILGETGSADGDWSPEEMLSGACKNAAVGAFSDCVSSAGLDAAAYRACQVGYCDDLKDCASGGDVHAAAEWNRMRCFLAHKKPGWR